MALAQREDKGHSFSPEIKKILTQNQLFVAFAGGVGQFGTNFAWFKEGKTILWLDVGAGFPHANTPGLSKILPDLRFLAYAPPSAVILTHGHEDHIGSLVHVLEFIPEKTPLFASPFTLALLKEKLAEVGYSLNYFSVHPVEKNQEFSVGHFKVHNFFMPHSIPQTFSVGFYSEKSKKRIYFTSDFKIQGEESRFSQKDIIRFAPVDFLFVDSTGSLNPGFTDPEEVVLKNLEQIIQNWQGRIFIATFSSQIQRIRFLFSLAKKYNRKIGIKGYSIKFHLKAAFEAGEFPIPFHQISEPSPKDEKSIWIVAGCQGEKGSSLQKLANGELENLKLKKGDLFIYSASMIPGNEERIYESLNKIAKLGVTIVGTSPADLKVHTSGHGRQSDMKEIISWLKPKRIIPIHGDPLHFHSFSQFLEPTEVAKKVRFAYQGSLYALTDEFTEVAQLDYLPNFLDGKEIHKDALLYQNRLRLAQAGICLLILNSKNSLLKVQYEAVATDEFIKELHPYLEKQIRSLLNTAINFSEKEKDKLISKINRLHEKELGKAPYLIFLKI